MSAGNGPPSVHTTTTRSPASGESTRRAVLAAAGASLLGALAACSTAATPAPSPGPAPGRAPGPAPGSTGSAPGSTGSAPQAGAGPDAPPAVMASRATVPVLCWHQIRDHRPGDPAYDKASLICPPAALRAQLDGLRTAGFSTIGPDDYAAHVATGAALPARPVLLTFDDGSAGQVANGLPELVRRRMTGTFFVMTVVLDKPNWMSRADVRRLRDSGMTVGAHTYDHHRADRYSGADWATQLDRPRRELEGITGAPVRHFAYPYGVWDAADFPHLDSAGYRTAFQLGDEPVDPGRPLLTLRRILVNSSWNGAAVVRAVSA